MKSIKIHDKEFEVSVNSEKIQDAINKIAEKINSELSKKEVVFIGILNGSFMFASDLFKKIDFNCRITFVKVSSYQGTSSSGVVKSLIGINENIKGKTVVVLEDIIDTGETLENIINQLKSYEPEEIKIATFLFKPLAFTKSFKIDYIGLEVPNDFIVGYGLDYNGFGRNHSEIYSLVKS
ncbi:MAG: hypoxanthine phosphoribosyltransferase [Bacteroidetes bacterium CG02_land_8_20_14_3_00_31_25]|nr:MAG: hypoxanthine phosphoribosyltransferase [Bacteroidetes bacterium CG02_land_8_20_14_3_00_31_25]